MTRRFLKLYGRSLLTFVLASLVVFQFISNQISAPDYAIPEYYKEEFQQSQQVINNLEKESQLNRKLIKSLQYEIILFDSTVVSANPEQLDSLFDDFFNSVR